LSEAYLADALVDAHRDDPEYGYRLLADEARDAGDQSLSVQKVFQRTKEARIHAGQRRPD